MDTSMDPMPAPFNRCKTCYKTLPNTLFKNCVDCRARNKKQKDLRAERNRLLKQSLEVRKNASSDNEHCTVVKENGKQFPVAPGTVMTKPRPSAVKEVDHGTVVAKSTLPKLRDLKGKEKQAAMKEIKTFLTKEILDNQGKQRAMRVDEPQRIMTNVGSVREFQTASALYEKLKSKASRASESGKKIKFHGCHSIVAVPSIDHHQRVIIVAKDLRKIARVAFVSPSRNTEKMSDGSFFQTFFDCNCLGAYSSTSGSQGTLKHLVMHPTDKRIDCGGSIQVTAETDSSHPAGIVGQKITVRIYH